MSKEQPKDAFDAFNTVDKLVSKQILGSDGAASWQEFKKDSELVNRQSNAPLAPLKKADKLGGFTSWKDERKREEEARKEAGSAGLGEGYTHFKQKDEDAATRKERKRIEQKIRPDDKEYFIKAGTFQGFKFDYVFTTRDTYGTGYYFDGSDSLKKLDGKLPAWAESKEPRSDEDDGGNNKRVLSPTEETKRKKKKRKKAPVIVEDPNNPLEQVQEAIKRRSERWRFGVGGNVLEGWESATDSAGRTYYFDRRTGETSWTNPQPDVLPGGWNVAKTADGKQYYYHTSGETRWEKPT